MLCLRCGSSGTLLRMKRDEENKLKPVSKSFETCTDCGGKGTSHLPFGPKVLEVGTRGFIPHPDWEREQDEVLHQLMVKRIKDRQNKRKN